MALLWINPINLDPVHGGRGRGRGRDLSPATGAFASQNAQPHRYAAAAKHYWENRCLSSYSPRLGLPFQFQNGSLSRSTSKYFVLCSGNRGGRRDEGKGAVEDDADAGIEEFMAAFQRKPVIDVRPLQEVARDEEEAVRRGKEMLFRQFCLHLGLTPREFRAMWAARGGGGGGDAEEVKLRLVRDFLEDWGWRYRPLSPRAAVEMLDEHVGSVDGRVSAPAPVAARRRLRPLLEWWW